MDIEKMSTIDISQENIKSISDKCQQLQELQKQYKDKEQRCVPKGFKREI